MLVVAHRRAPDILTGMASMQDTSGVLAAAAPHDPAGNAIVFPAEFTFRADQRRIVFAAVVCMVIVQTIFGLMALAMLSIPLAIVFCVLLLPSPYVLKLAHGVLTRVVLDRDRLYVVRRDWLLRGGSRQKIDVFVLDQCVLSKTDNVRVIHQRAPRQYFRIPKELRDVELLERTLDQRVATSSMEQVQSELVDLRIEQGIEFRYGSGLKALLTSIGFVAFSAILRGVTTGDWSPGNIMRPSGESAIAVIGSLVAFLGYVFGPRYRVNRQELTQIWLGSEKTFPYDEIDKCYYHKRLGMNFLTARSSERSITILPKFLTDFDSLARTLRLYCPDAWPWYVHPYRVEIKPFSKFGAITLYLLFGALAAGIGLGIAYAFERNYVSTAIICVATAWWILANAIRWHMRSRLMRLVLGSDIIDWISAKTARRYPIAELIGITCKENSGVYEFGFEFQEPYKAFKLNSSSIDEPGLEMIEILRQLYPHVEIAGAGAVQTAELPEKWNPTDVKIAGS